MKSEVFTEVKEWKIVFRVMTPCSLVCAEDLQASTHNGTDISQFAYPAFQYITYTL
jgi:hypothetical protein